MVHQDPKMAQTQSDHTVNEQEKRLRESIHYFRGIDKPLSNGPAVGSLPDLIRNLHRIFESDSVEIAMVNHVMMMYQSNPKEWNKYAKFDRFKYTRNLVDAGNGKFNLMILCWGEGQGSAIHDHSDSHCFMKMLKGELEETRYTMPKNRNPCSVANADIGKSIDDDDCNDSYVDTEELQETKRSRMMLNDVVYMNDDLGLHRVENPSHSDTAVSLHLYCPPYDKCSVYQKNSGKKTECRVTFWSRYGDRTNEE